MLTAALLTKHQELFVSMIRQLTTLLSRSTMQLWVQSFNEPSIDRLHSQLWLITTWQPNTSVLPT